MGYRLGDEEEIVELMAPFRAASIPVQIERCEHFARNSKLTVVRHTDPARPLPTDNLGFVESSDAPAWEAQAYADLYFDSLVVPAMVRKQELSRNICHGFRLDSSKTGLIDAALAIRARFNDLCKAGFMLAFPEARRDDVVPFTGFSFAAESGIIEKAGSFVLVRTGKGSDYKYQVDALDMP